MTGDRRLRLNEKPNRAIFLSWLAVCALLLLTARSKIIESRFPGPDDTLRLVQLRDLLAGQGWYDLHQYRIDAPDGVLMHWSRIVDVPLWAFMKMLTPMLGQAQAEQVTMIVLPLLVLGLILVAIGRLAWRLFDVQTAVFACLAVAFWSQILVQVQPLRIDHHSYQIMCVAMAAWALSWRSPFRGGAFAGLMMAMGTMISLETLPMTATFGGILALRWFADYKARWWLVSYMQALALGMVVLFALTRATDLAQHCDVIAPAHLGFFLITALGTGAIAALPQMPRPALFILFSLVGAAGLGFVAMTAAQCFVPPFSDLDPVLRQQWYLAVLEGLPIWHHPANRAIPAIAQSLVALGACIALWARSQDWQRRWWLEYSLLMLAAIVAGCLTFRSMAFPAVLGAVPMGWLAHQLLRHFRATDRLPAKLMTALTVYLLLLPSTPVIVYEKLIKRDDPATQNGPLQMRDSACHLEDNAYLLDKLPPSKLFATLDIGPVILLETHHSVVATGHHRAPRAMLAVIHGFTGTPDQARSIVSSEGARFVVLCSDLHEAAKWQRLGGGDSLAAHLMAKDPPNWLVREDIGGPDELQVWRVVDQPEVDQITAMPDGTSTPAH